MKASRWLLFGLLIFLDSVVHAENGCPPGMIPASGTNINSCVPIPPGYYGSQQQRQLQRYLPPPPQWATRWGAIATDGPKGSLGSVSGLTNKEDAEQAAMLDCAEKGGTQCKIDIAYHNQCAAVVVGSKGYNVGHAATTDEVVKLGMKVCTDAKSFGCHVYYSACSLAERIQ